MIFSSLFVSFKNATILSLINNINMNQKLLEQVLADKWLSFSSIQFTEINSLMK